MSPADVAGLISDLWHWGPLGLWLVANISGIEVPGWIYKAKDREAAAWKAMYESERDAHQQTRSAMAVKDERLQVAIESGKVTEELLREARSRVASRPKAH